MANPGSGRRPLGRLGELDVVRGLAIVGVVYLHAWFSPWAVTPHSDLFAAHVIHLFAHTAVPLFLFLAAYFQSRDRTASFVAFQRKKALRVYLPMLVWMLAALAYRIWQEGWHSDLLRSFALFDISGQFYYLWVLAFFYALFFWARDWSERRLRFLAVAAFTLNLAAILWYEHGPALDGDYGTLAFRNPAVWVFPYAFGFWISRRIAGFAFGARATLALAALLALLGLAHLLAGERFGAYPASYFGLSQYLFSAAALLTFPALAAALLSWRVGAWLLLPFRRLSGYAFAIYLVHMPFFIGYVTQRYVSDSRLQNDWWELMNGIFIVGFAAALAFVVVASALWPGGAGLLLGVERSAAPPWPALLSHLRSRPRHGRRPPPPGRAERPRDA